MKEDTTIHQVLTKSVDTAKRVSSAGLLVRLGAITTSWRLMVLVLIVVTTLIRVLAMEPIAQSPAYHAFADSRRLFSIPNGWNVLSNLPFLLVGLIGLRTCRLALDRTSAHVAWTACFAGFCLVSFGSAFYHWRPDSDSLVWDRLPMTIGFMGLFVAVLAEAICIRLVRRLLLPALALGAVSVLYWHWADDLRFYYWIQTIPLLSIPVLLVLFRGGVTHRWLQLPALGCYGFAKVAETNDLRIFELTGGIVSGHTVKHVLAATGGYVLVRMLRRRSVSGRASLPASRAATRPSPASIRAT